MLAALFAVASGRAAHQARLGERRDWLRDLLYACLAFAVLLAPPPMLQSASWSMAHELLYTTATLALPALCVHFFALFPEPRAPRGRVAAGTVTAYAIAALLTLGWVVALLLRAAGHGPGAPLLGLLQSAAAVWFASGLLLAVALFARSYLRAGSDDARRRLRVALVGTALGLGPLAALIVWRNLAPDMAVPGERLAVVLTLLVPLSFTWATVIHRVFDFRVAVRAAVAPGARDHRRCGHVAGELPRPRPPTAPITEDSRWPWSDSARRWPGRASAGRALGRVVALSGSRPSPDAFGRRAARRRAVTCWSRRRPR
jgi:hypothetical protein